MRTLLLGGFIAAAILSLEGCTVDLPESISFIVEWRLVEGAPNDLEEFVALVRSENKVMMKEAGFFNPIRWLNYYGRLRLGAKSGLSHLYITYEYAVEQPSGEWEDEKKTIEIKSENGNMTIGELLFRIQHQTGPELNHDDVFYFPEELIRSDEGFREGVPSYDLFLGS